MAHTTFCLVSEGSLRIIGLTFIAPLSPLSRVEFKRECGWPAIVCAVTPAAVSQPADAFVNGESFRTGPGIGLRLGKPSALNVVFAPRPSGAWTGHPLRLRLFIIFRGVGQPFDTSDFLGVPCPCRVLCDRAGVLTFLFPETNAQNLHAIILAHPELAISRSSPLHFVTFSCYARAPG